MKILVTGGAGYIGSVTTRALMNAGHQVVVYDNLSTGFRDAVPAGAKFIFGDVRDGDLVLRVMKDEGVEGVIHFAAKLVVPESVEKPSEYYDVNVLGGLNLIRAALEKRVKAFVFSSTAAVYGNPTQVPVKEDAPLNPLNPYGASKVMIENVLSDCHRAHGFPFISLRYFNVAGATHDLGVGQKTKDATHLIKVVAEAAAGKREAVEIFGTDYPTKDGTGVRDYIHVEDLANAHILALEHLGNGGSSEILNCGYGSGFSVREVLSVMKELGQSDFRIREQGRRHGDAAEVVADSSRLQALLGWKPKYASLNHICRTSLEWERKLP